MRKIVFRGKRLNGGWARGGISPAWHTGENGTETPDGLAIIDTGHAYAVEQDSIGQFTGRYDKNHQPIFEDDLVTATHADGEGIVRGRVRYGLHRANMSQPECSVGFWIDWADDEFLRKELGFWADKLTVIGPWADAQDVWDRWCEEATAIARAKEM